MPSKDDNQIQEKKINKWREIILRIIKEEEKPSLVLESEEREESARQRKQISKPKRNFWLIIWLIITFVSFFIIVVFGIFVYSGLCPAAIIVGKFENKLWIKVLEYNKFKEKLNVLFFYYQKEPKLKLPPTEKIKEDILEKLIRDELTKKLAQEKGIKVSLKEVDERIKIFSREGWFEESVKRYKELYNWSLEDIKIKLLEPLLLREKLENILSLDEELNRENKKRAEEILNRLEKGENFNDLAREFSQDLATAFKGGDLGYLKLGQMPKALEEIVFSSELITAPVLVKTDHGYHIIRILKREEDRAWLQHILIRYKTLDEWIEEQRKEIKVYKFM